MNIKDIKVGETYQYYWYDSHGHLRHNPVEIVKINQKSVRVRQGSDEFRIDPSEIDNKQVEAFT